MSFFQKIIQYMQTKSPGARTLKTGIAISISLFICQALQIQSLVLAGAATISNMQPGTGESIKNAKDQAKAHIIAIVTAIFFGVVFGPSPLVMGIVTIVIITICLKLNVQTSIHAAILASIFILYSPGANYVEGALGRTAAIFVGISVAFLVNITILPPNNEKRLKEDLLVLHKEMYNFLDEALHNYLYLEETSRDEIDQMAETVEEAIVSANVYFDSYKSEIEIKNELRNQYEKFYGDYITYQEILFAHIKEMHLLNEKRRRRIYQNEEDLLDAHFSEINCFILQIFTDFQIYNDQVLKIIRDEPFEVHDKKSIWDNFNLKIMEQFDSVENKKNFVPAVMEASVIVYKLRWAIEEARKIAKNNVNKKVTGK